ncbi:hypothetical protein ACFW17_25530 [Streptomyces sp. NPDC058961]|uniref:hypothetical protein n=1 Tax=Streptomyces TaxID=1883 RepID=UPI001DF16923|nr:hypothetical protein [Streptomyces sp. MAG02]
MVDAPTGSGGDGKWLIGAVGTALAVAAFFGIHNFSELKDWVNGTTHTVSTSQPIPSASPKTSCSTTLLYCGTVHFSQVGPPQFEGPCNSVSNGGCPVSRVVTNIGTETGGATVNFLLDKQGDTSASEPAGSVGSCTAIVPSTPKGGSVTARCTINASYQGSVSLRSTVNNPTG